MTLTFVCCTRKNPNGTLVNFFIPIPKDAYIVQKQVPSTDFSPEALKRFLAFDDSNSVMMPMPLDILKRDYPEALEHIGYLVTTGRPQWGPGYRKQTA